MQETRHTIYHNRSFLYCFQQNASYGNQAGFRPRTLRAFLRLYASAGAEIIHSEDKAPTYGPIRLLRTEFDGGEQFLPHTPDAHRPHP